MPTETIKICTTCGGRGCDGGVWKLVKCVRLKDGVDTTAGVHSDNLVDCTVRWLGTKKTNFNVPVGTLVEKEFKNWSNPSKVTLEKIEM